MERLCLDPLGAPRVGDDDVVQGSLHDHVLELVDLASAAVAVEAGQDDDRRGVGAVAEVDFDRERLAEVLWELKEDPLALLLRGVDESVDRLSDGGHIGAYLGEVCVVGTGSCLLHGDASARGVAQRARHRRTRSLESRCYGRLRGQEGSRSWLAELQSGGCSRHGHSPPSGRGDGLVLGRGCRGRRHEIRRGSQRVAL